MVGIEQQIVIILCITIFGLFVKIFEEEISKNIFWLDLIILGIFFIFDVFNAIKLL